MPNCPRARITPLTTQLPFIVSGPVADCHRATMNANSSANRCNEG